MKPQPSRRDILRLGGLGALSLLHPLLLGGSAGCQPEAAPADPSMPPPDPSRPWWLTGNFAPVPERELTEITLEGTLPDALDGLYLRNGANPMGAPPAHWFLGDGMVHGVRLQGGQALWYRNRWIRSNAVSQALGEVAAPGPRARSDTVNTNVIGHAGKTWALVEAGGYPVQLGEDLQTLAHDNFGGSLRGSFTAHAHRDPATGELHGICYEATDPDHIRHVVVGVDGRVRRERLSSQRARRRRVAAGHDRHHGAQRRQRRERRHGHHRRFHAGPRYRLGSGPPGHRGCRRGPHADRAGPAVRLWLGGPLGEPQ